MQLNDHWRKIVKTMIFAFLCTEMQTTFTHGVLEAQRSIGLSEMRAIGKGVDDSGDSKMMTPHQASIRLMAEEREYFGKGHICSGALVAPSVVLTVASCLVSREGRGFYHPSELRVMLGNAKRFAPSELGLVFGVTHIHLPPKDLALAILMLDQDVPSDHPLIQPVGLPSRPPSDLLRSSFAPDGKISTWGADAQIRELHDLVTRSVDLIPCTMRQAKKEPAGTKRICVKDKDYGRNRIYMEAGATLTVQDRLLGLQSLDGGFEDVASHVEWILGRIGDGSNQNSSVWGVLGFLVFTGYVLAVSRKSFSI
ncbi:hypothetical protein KR009_007618 [Drosophila setifemur]|nr:hypothetical protein KR009_007618 [Drosophila setifemur]